MNKIFFILTLLSATAFTQSKIETVTIKSDDFVEEFDLKIEEDTVKHGPYKKYKKGALIEYGTYLYGKRNHVWTYYHANGKKQAEGLFIDNEQGGLWSYYDQNGNLVQKYNHTTDSLHFFVRHNPNEQHFFREEGKDSTSIMMDSPPLFIGGLQYAVDLAYDCVTYPETAKVNQTEGMAYITLWITTDGKAIEHRIHKDPGDGCAEEALKCIKALPDEWIPGTINGKKVETKLFFPIHFRLN
ncbi:MAG: energy transducer TonB [Flavobacteriales bacterium]|nr:energy transducer TonB [Flavobacteriales bacterium]